MQTTRDQENERAAQLLKALAHPVRLCIVRSLMERGRTNVSYMDACLSLSQSGISQHLAKLKSAGIVQGTREGNEVYYELCNDNVKALIQTLFNEKLEG